MKDREQMTRQETTRLFRRALELAIRERRWTQAQLARSIRVSQPTIGNWLRGKYVPSANEVFAMEGALRIVPGSLSRHLGYLPASPESQLGRIFAVLLASSDGREILASLGSTKHAAAPRAA